MGIIAKVVLAVVLAVTVAGLGGISAPSVGKAVNAGLAALFAPPGPTPGELVAQARAQAAEAEARAAKAETAAALARAQAAERMALAQAQTQSEAMGGLAKDLVSALAGVTTDLARGSTRSPTVVVAPAAPKLSATQRAALAQLEVDSSMAAARAEINAVEGLDKGSTTEKGVHWVRVDSRK